MPKALPGISTKFKDALEKSEQEKKIVQLQAEIEKLRAAYSPELEVEIERLRQQLEKESGEIEIDVGLIDQPFQREQMNC